MVGNDKFLFIATNQTKYALRVRKSDLTVTNAGEWGLGAKVSSMSSDERGYITINFGSGGHQFWQHSVRPGMGTTSATSDPSTSSWRTLTSPSAPKPLRRECFTSSAKAKT